MLLEHILHQSSHHCYCHESHDQPSHTAFGQVPFKCNLDEVGIEDDGIDDDSRRKNEVQDELQHMGRLAHFVFIPGDQCAAHLRGYEEPDELQQIYVEIFGFVDAEDIEEGTEDGQKGCRDNPGDDESEEQLRHHVQGMGGKTPVVHASFTHKEQDAGQHISEEEAIGEKERLQVECHHWQEQQSRNNISPAVHFAQPESQYQQRKEQRKDVFVDTTEQPLHSIAPFRTTCM